jgi:hypothetical protein
MNSNVFHSEKVTVGSSFWAELAWGITFSSRIFIGTLVNGDILTGNSLDSAKSHGSRHPSAIGNWQ